MVSALRLHLDEKSNIIEKNNSIGKLLSLFLLRISVGKIAKKGTL
jgi:hypothetical protein